MNQQRRTNASGDYLFLLLLQSQAYGQVSMKSSYSFFGSQAKSDDFSYTGLENFLYHSLGSGLLHGYECLSICLMSVLLHSVTGIPSACL